MNKKIETKQEKEKKPKIDFIIDGSFSLRVSNRKAKKALTYSLTKDCSQIKNVIIMLRNSLYTQSKTSKFNKEIYDLFLSNEILRESVYGRIGSEKTKDDIKKLTLYFKNNELFNHLCEFSQQKIDAHNFVSIVNAIKSNFKTFNTNLNKYKENKAAYAKEMGNSGMPKPPKQKKLSRINNASLEIDKQMWSFRKETKIRYIEEEKILKSGKIKKIRKKTKERYDYLRVRIGKYTNKIPLNLNELPKPKGKEWRSLNVSHRNNEIYLNFTYGHLDLPIVNDLSIKKIKKVKKIPKYAAADVGLINTLSVFVYDKETPSFMLSGKRFIDYNCKYNKMVAKLSASISEEATEWKSVKIKTYDTEGNVIKDEKGEEVKEEISIPTDYNERGCFLLKFKSFLTEKRNRFFKEEFEKMSTHLVDYLEKNKITDFVTSKNLSFAKIKGDIKMHKKTKQKFYQIPFGKLLNMIERKCKLKDINFHNIDEAHTSKTSCLSKNINKIVKLRKTRKKSLSTNDYGGSRVKRGLYKDYENNILFNADINGAINQLKIKFKRLDFSWLVDFKGKICNPLRIKSDEEFIQKLLVD